MKKLFLAAFLLTALVVPSWAAVIGAVKDAGWVGAYTAGATVNIDFTTYDTTAGTATALAGTPKADVYCNGSATPVATAITITASLNSVVGFNTVAIDTTGYAAGKCTAVISAGTVTSSVVGFRIGNFDVGVPQSADLRSVNGGTTGATAGQLNLDKLVIAPAGMNATAVTITPSGTGDGVRISAAGGGNALKLNVTSGSGNALSIDSVDGAAIRAYTSGDGTGLALRGFFGADIDSLTHNAINIQGPLSGDGGWPAILVNGGVGGPGMLVVGGSNTGTFLGGDAVQLVGGVGSATQHAGRAIVEVSGKTAGVGAPETVLVTGAAYNDGDNIDAGGGNVTVTTMTPGGTGAGIDITAGGIVGSLLAVQKNAAYSNFMVKLVLASDNKSAATGKTPACTISQNGGAFAACTNTPATEVSSGWYKINLTQAEMNADEIVVRFTATGANTSETRIHTNP